jgi:hypothetical protein
MGLLNFSMTPTTKAYRNYLREVRRTPVKDGFVYIHEHLRTLAANNYFNEAEPWEQADQLAASAKYLYLFGPIQSRKRRLTISNLFNRYKDFWGAAEKENPYFGDPELLAAFVLRFEYQQQPFRIYLDRVPRMFLRTRELYIECTGDLSREAMRPGNEFQRHCGISLESFLRIAEKLYSAYKLRVNWGREDLVGLLGSSDSPLLAPFLQVMSADGERFSSLYKQTKADNLIDTPYDFNPLLRYPIVLYEGQLCAPFPELIAYAATRGLFFYLSDILGDSFSRVFGDIFAIYAARLVTSKLGVTAILTEKDERSLGWTGKTNDFTLMMGDLAVLFECKTSALFLSAKKHASLQEVRDDLKKNLVNPKGKKGLFQLYKKTEAIKSRSLPEKLNQKYRDVKRIYPVILLYDQIQFANKPEALRNILDAELRSSGITDFQYQVWHVEELENLLELIPAKDLARVITKKFEDEKAIPWDLNTLIYEETLKKYRYLCPFMFIPKGDGPALRMMETLRDA